MKSTLNTAFSLFVLSLIMACEDPDIGTEKIDPFMKVVFINQTLLDQKARELQTVEADIKVIDDSLAVIQNLIDGGDPTDYTANIESRTDDKKILNLEKSTIENVILNIENGEVKIDGIASPDGNNVILPTDSASNYRFPLNSGADFSIFEISLAGSLYDLEATYKRDTLVRERIVIIEALNLNASSNDFNSISIEHGDTLTFKSNEAKVTLYF